MKPIDGEPQDNGPQNQDQYQLIAAKVLHGCALRVAGYEYRVARYKFRVAFFCTLCTMSSLRGVGPTLRPVSPTGWKRGRRLRLL